MHEKRRGVNALSASFFDRIDRIYRKGKAESGYAEKLKRQSSCRSVYFQHPVSAKICAICVAKNPEEKPQISQIFAD
jgi:hypothetical protein